MSSHWRDKEINEIIARLVEKHGISEILVVDAIADYFKAVKTAMQCEDMPRVLMKGFGSFSPFPGYLKRKKTWFEKRGKDTSQIDKVLERLDEEKQSRSHNKESSEEE